MQGLKKILKKIGSRNGVRLMFLLGYLVAFGIPLAYSYLAKPPGEGDMRVSEGAAHFQYRMKQGYMLVVDGNNYTCGGAYLNADPSCFNLKEWPVKRALLEGKLIQVIWFRQAAHIFGSVRRVADIRYDGVSQFSVGYLEQRLQYERESSKLSAVVTFFVMLLVLLFYEWMDRIRIRNERRFG
ncbi:Uncharacterised protein [Achromobacter xylosoxidans]|uniref:hypothetical protein n=1 Tax=Alcaligenes xylosoxydans xylosoxydans TaxID=85698 RepID=UPI0006C130C2|nr:hypothetical protein [Achromobacter xylosoxidans]CUJ12853.1 Uncharacterised protein [Achromobacter xylosoxidans]